MLGLLNVALVCYVTWQLSIGRCDDIHRIPPRTHTHNPFQFLPLLAAMNNSQHDNEPLSSSQMMVTTASHRENSNDEDDDGADDWEEWDGRSPFWAHCVAGSLAGVVEHAAIYPLDTVRTHIQVCAACIHRNTAAAAKLNATTATATTTSPTTTTAAAHNASSLLRASTSTAAAAAAVSSPMSSSTTTTATAASSSLHRLPLGMWQTIRFLVSEPAMATTATNSLSTTAAAQSTTTSSSTTLVGQATSITQAAANVVKGWSRLFRGVQTILIGCVPAHALYFSSYETIKAHHLDPETGHVSAWGSSLAGAAAVASHDAIMTPLDTVKQRLQIGHYSGAWPATRAICQQEGFIALYRSFPITLASNIPYGMVMVSTHEACKDALRESPLLAEHYRLSQWQVVLAASSVAGFVASAVTTPLDRIKTALQTQQLTPVCAALQVPCPLTTNQNAMTTPKLLNWEQAALTIWRQEGVAGFFRGVTPRILSHTPAVAISWTTYESAKHYLLSHYSRG
jgi:solute carrier family 25 (mitochondrial iron transporter), member 28/37